jgi:ABC-type glycerol-3-phosphate transport system permease component
LFSRICRALSAGIAKTIGQPVVAVMLNSLVMATIVIGIRQMTGGGIASRVVAMTMCHSVCVSPLPIAVVLLMQRWFVTGLVESEK